MYQCTTAGLAYITSNLWCSPAPALSPQLCREKLLTGSSAVSGVSVLAGVFLSSSHEEVLKCKAELEEMDTVLRNVCDALRTNAIAKGENQRLQEELDRLLPPLPFSSMCWDFIKTNLLST
ncbi:uncharacterized protein WM277_009174 isoform 1-T1 [Molossus nigricans]